MTSSSKVRRASLQFGSDELKERNDELRRQMEEMRSSSEGELLKAWAEVEELQDEKEEILEMNQDLIIQLGASRDRERRLLKQIEDSQQKGAIVNLRSLLGGGKGKVSRNSSMTSKTSDLYDSLEFDSFSVKMENEDGTLAKNDAESTEMVGLSYPPIQKIILAEKEKLERDFTIRVKQIEEQKNEIITTCKYQLQCQEEVVETLEEQGGRQKENLKRLRNEIMQREADSQVREHEHQSHVMTLKKKLEEKRKIIAKQDKKIKQYRDYIGDLTSVLEKVSGEGKFLTNKQTTIPRTSISGMNRQTNVPASA